MQGGLPVIVDGEVIGGIGASFATPEEDEQVAKVGTRRAQRVGLGGNPWTAAGRHAMG
jgi:glc operon protein GlcG